MAKSKDNLHKGHRERMKSQFIAKNAVNPMPPHNILEILLFYSIPRSDTNEQAHRLIDRFGSLRGVFDAPFDSLLEVEGIGERTAALIKLVAESSKVYFGECESDIEQIDSTVDAVNYLRAQFMSPLNETLYIFCLNNAGKILKFAAVNEGKIDSAKLDMRKIMSLILDTGATAVVIANSRPGGMCAPSQADSDAAYCLARLIKTIHTRLLDYIIISDDSYFSFADTPKFCDCITAPPLFESYASDAQFDDEELDF